MTHNVVNTKTYRRDDPKLITMAAAEKLFLENPDQVKLLPRPPARSSQAEEKDAEETMRKRRTRFHCNADVLLDTLIIL